MTQPEETADETGEVHGILESIAAEGELARLDARLAELDDEVERAVSEAERAVGLNRREIELMRARIEDALNNLSESTATQRGAWEQTGARLDEVARSLGEDLARATADVREELRSERGRSRASAEELELILRAEVERSRVDAEQLVDGTRAELAELRSELEGAAGELRAGQNLATQRIEERLHGVRGDLESAVSSIRDRAAQHEQEFAEAIEVVGTELRSATERLGDAVDRERETRAGAGRALRDEVDEIRARLEEVDANATTLTGRQDVEVGRLQRLLTDLTARVEALSRTRATEPAGAEAVAMLSDRVDGLAERIERAESIARESGRLLLSLLRKRNDEASAEGRPAEEPARQAEG